MKHLVIGMQKTHLHKCMKCQKTQQIQHKQKDVDQVERQRRQTDLMNISCTSENLNFHVNALYFTYSKVTSKGGKWNCNSSFKTLKYLGYCTSLFTANV